MEKQGEQISRKLDKINPESGPHVCVSGFRYSEPRTGQMINDLKDAERIILFSQYPQTHCSTSGSSLCDA
jgi:ferrochelatase